MMTFAHLTTMVDIGTDIKMAVSLLNDNELVGIPTETVYGLAGNALNEEAILKIYETKKRPRFDPLIAHIDGLDKLKGLVKEVPEKANQLIEKFWPGPLTLLLKKTDLVPDLLTSGLDRVAIRVPNHPLALSLLRELSFPLAAPSANPFGYVSPTTALHVSDQLGVEIPYILDGGTCEIGVESTIIGFSEEGNPIVYRLGGTKVEDIEDAVGMVDFDLNVSSDPTAPGMLKSHYSPGKPLVVGDIKENLKRFKGKNLGVISFDKQYDGVGRNIYVLSPKRSIEEAARNIFAALRKMDNDEVEVVLAEYVPDEGLGKAINDRLRRAATT
ncbi:MAG: L-threonylcarbamoyladenylate synthase [Bacteroidota bacterium]